MGRCSIKCALLSLRSRLNPYRESALHQRAAKASAERVQTAGCGIWHRNGRAPQAAGTDNGHAGSACPPACCCPAGHVARPMFKKGAHAPSKMCSAMLLDGVEGWCQVWLRLPDPGFDSTCRARRSQHGTPGGHSYGCASSEYTCLNNRHQKGLRHLTGRRACHLRTDTALHTGQQTVMSAAQPCPPANAAQALQGSMPRQQECPTPLVTRVSKTARQHSPDRNVMQLVLAGQRREGQGNPLQCRGAAHRVCSWPACSLASPGTSPGAGSPAPLRTGAASAR